MANKKKPEGKEWDVFVDEWYANAHEGKVALAKKYNVTYDTAKHLISESGATRKRVKPDQRMTITIPELLSMRPSVNLDFACFDIETSNLQADFSIVLTACIKPYGQEALVFRADDYPEWEGKRADDYQIVKDIADELRKHAIIITHYGTYFDIPFLRAKMMKHNLEPLPQMFAVDTWQIAHKNFKMSSRRLQNMSSFFDLGEKTVVEGGLWMEAAYNGSKEAMDRIVAHNIRDVEILEKLACISFLYIRSISRL